MTDTSPAELLRAAAERLRQLATAAAHDGRTRWEVDSRAVVDNHERPAVLIETYAARPESVSRYIAAMDPAVGLALAALLEEVADSVEDDGGIVQDSTTASALTVARQILGEETQR